MKFGIILFFLAFAVFARTASAQNDYTGKLRLDLSVDRTEWNVGSRVTAKAKVENISKEKVEFTLAPTFELAKQAIPKGEYSGGYVYISTENAETSGTFIKISLNKNESKTVKFEVTKLGWLGASESVIFGDNWFYIVPKGEYELYYDFQFDLGKTDKLPRFGRILSNKVDVRLNSEK